MKTQEQLKLEVVSYLNKTSNHLFTRENGDLYKVIVEGDNFIVMDGDKVTVYSINDYIGWYGINNVKCAIKHRLFLNKNLKCIKNFKSMKGKVSKIKESISGKTDKVEITKLVTQQLTGETSITEERKSFISKLFGKK